MSSHLFSPQTKAYTARLLKPSLRISCLAIKILAFQWAFDLTLNGLPLLKYSEMKGRHRVFGVDSGAARKSKDS